MVRQPALREPDGALGGASAPLTPLLRAGEPAGAAVRRPAAAAPEAVSFLYRDRRSAGERERIARAHRLQSQRWRALNQDVERDMLREGAVLLAAA